MHIIRGIHEQFADLNLAHEKLKDQSASVDRILVDCMEYINRFRPVMKVIADKWDDQYKNEFGHIINVSEESKMIDEFEGLFFKDEYKRIVQTHKIKSAEHFQEWRTNITKEAKPVGKN